MRENIQVILYSIYSCVKEGKISKNVTILQEIVIDRHWYTSCESRMCPVVQIFPAKQAKKLSITDYNFR